MSAGSRWAVIAAAGAGSRFGGAKQFEQLDGRSMIAIAVDLFAQWDGVVVVLPPGSDARPEAAQCVTGGATRRQSVAAGIGPVPDGAGVIAVHDAARPLATTRLLDVLAKRLERGDVDGVVPGRPLVDAVKQLDDDGVITTTVPRDRLWTAQTPQLFRADALRAAHERAPADTDAPDDASLLEALGLRVAVVGWPEPNPKVTAREDLERLRAQR